ncbi:signal peptidase I [Entomospira nematocerorum]|uniref:Signal peptidase I n=1 Tax=Entomospira nematocerorum TaxID=2719987 RepID=A0A968KT67_9SPIO|nr:signal peptidase I [Entomospira nematocera]NIZ47340.1 signal peptidase I [Entomospira nematocera]WDI34118.1 signal peptidase I [Entomospira nematocera]
MLKKNRVAYSHIAPYKMIASIILLLCFLSTGIYLVWGIEIFQVQGDSMSPTLPHGSWILVDKFRPYWQKLSTGDIILIESSEKEHIVKRIALQGKDVLQWQDQNLFIPLYATYVPVSSEVYDLLSISTILNKHQIFIIGDNIPISYDSRIYGTISIQQVIGKVILTHIP